MYEGRKDRPVSEYSVPEHPGPKLTIPNLHGLDHPAPDLLWFWTPGSGTLLYVQYDPEHTTAKLFGVEHPTAEIYGFDTLLLDSMVLNTLLLNSLILNTLLLNFVVLKTLPLNSDAEYSEPKGLEHPNPEL